MLENCKRLICSPSLNKVYCIVVWCGVVWCGVVWCGVVWCGVVWCIVLYCIVLYCIVLYCIVLYCILTFPGVWVCLKTRKMSTTSKNTLQYKETTLEFDY